MYHGISTFLHAPLADENAKTYSAAPSKLSGAIEATPTINYNSTPIYSDNRLKYKDVTFSDGTIALTVDYADKEILSPLFGRKVEEVSFTPQGGTTAVTTKKHISNAKDIPVPQGFGYIISDFDVDKRKDVFTVRFFYKIEFANSFQTVRTQEGNKTFTAAQLTGTVYSLPNGDWMEEIDFDSLDVAIEYLKTLFVLATPEA
jgi:hypothetical protein